MKILIIGVIYLLMNSLLLYAQDIHTTKLDALFDKIVTHDKAMGSVSVFKDGNEIYQRSFGFSDIDATIFADENTKYKIGSISKMYTAAIILKLVEEEKLKLSTKLEEFFPRLPNADKITIKNLLNHSSGLYNYTSIKEFYKWVQQEYTQQELLNKFIENGIVFEPNSKNKYSNTNFVLLAFIAEKIHKKPFKEILDKELLVPLELHETQIGRSLSNLKNEAYSYKKNSKWNKVSKWNMDNAIGAGSIIATPKDVNKFINLLFSYKILKKRTVSNMMKLTNNYGLALFKYKFHEIPFYGHGGSIDRFRSLTGYNYDNNLSFTLCLNGSLINRNRITKAIIAVFYGKTYQIPELNIIEAKNTSELEGIYGGEAYNYKLKVFTVGKELMIQRTGQSPVKMDAVSERYFKNDRLKITIKFTPNDKQLEFIQKSKGYFLYKL